MRAALDELRNGDPSTAINAYNEHDRIFTADNADTLRDRLVGDWWHARAEHGADSAIMIAARRSDVDDLNARARLRMKAAGQLSGAELTVDDRSFQVGDDVLCLRNDRSLGVLNGTRGTVTSVDVPERTLTLSTTSGTSIRVPAAYIDAGHVTHGYAITGHKAQGMTSDHAFVLGSDTIYREWGYVSMSRGRGINRLYAVADGLDVDETHEPSPRRRAHGGRLRWSTRCVALKGLRSLSNAAILRSPGSPADRGADAGGLRHTSHLRPAIPWVSGDCGRTSRDHRLRASAACHSA